MNTQDQTAQITRCIESHGINEGFCNKLFNTVIELKAQLENRYEQAFPSLIHQIRNAVAEAEELAWETAFPHLFLPDLAEARVADVVRSEREQRYYRAA